MNSLSCSHSVMSDPPQNLLLAALPAETLARWLPYLECIDLPAGKVLCESSCRTTYAYFPTTAVISLLCITEEGGTSEVAVVGDDGVVGVSMIMGGTTMLNRAVVQSSGLGFRLPSLLVTAEMERAGPSLQLMLRYTQSLITQVMQIAACNRHHTIAQQLARRLLTALDTSPNGEVAMTQEGVASLLGVRREGVTTAALKLQRAGVIRYQRGHIFVLDRDSLETHTCECYAALTKEHKRLLPMLVSTRRLAPMAIAA